MFTSYEPGAAAESEEEAAPLSPRDARMRARAAMRDMFEAGKAGDYVAAEAALYKAWCAYESQEDGE